MITLKPSFHGDHRSYPLSWVSTKPTSFHGCAPNSWHLPGDEHWTSLMQSPMGCAPSSSSGCSPLYPDPTRPHGRMDLGAHPAATHCVYISLTWSLRPPPFASISRSPGHYCPTLRSGSPLPGCSGAGPDWPPVTPQHSLATRQPHSDHLSQQTHSHNTFQTLIMSFCYSSHRFPVLPGPR